MRSGASQSNNKDGVTMLKKSVNALTKALRADGIRITPQRIAILETLAISEDHPDAYELHRRVQQNDPKVSLTTVYRTLAALERQGLVRKHLFGGSTGRFETSGTPRHGHLIDIDSGEIIEFSSPEIEKIQHQIAQKYGLKVVHQKLEIYCRKMND